MMTFGVLWVVDLIPETTLFMSKDNFMSLFVIFRMLNRGVRTPRLRIVSLDNQHIETWQARRLTPL